MTQKELHLQRLVNEAKQEKPTFLQLAVSFYKRKRHGVWRIGIRFYVT